MKAKLLIRIAVGCIVFFALGHTMGHFTRHNVTNPTAIAVQKMMIENKFDMFGAMRSYDENYTGMSTNLIITLLAFVAVLLIISSNLENNKSLSIKLILPVAISLFAFSVTGFLYFFLLPAITCLIAGALLIIAVLQLRKQ